MHFLVIDKRFGSPVFVFLERDPGGPDGVADLPGRWVSLSLSASIGTDTTELPTGLTGAAAVGVDPDNPNRFEVFESEGDVRAAGFSLIEPRYVGPTWESYRSVFHPEGGKRTKVPTNRPRGLGRVL